MGPVPRLVRMLGIDHDDDDDDGGDGESETVRTSEHAAGALRNIAVCCWDDVQRTEILNAGAARPLVAQLCQTKNAASREQAARAVRSLIVGDAHRAQLFVGANAVPPLVRMLQDRTATRSSRREAAGALKGLVWDGSAAREQGVREIAKQIGQVGLPSTAIKARLDKLALG